MAVTDYPSRTRTPRQSSARANIVAGAVTRANRPERLSVDQITVSQPEGWMRLVGLFTPRG
jgi:hypothetical protein